MNERLKQFVSALSDAAKRQEELSGELSGKERPDIASLKKLRDSADAKCSELDFNIRSTEENIKRLTDLAADCRKRMEALNARREIYARQREFADMMSGAKGISFTRYVLGVMLDMVTDEANNMLANIPRRSFRAARNFSSPLCWAWRCQQWCRAVSEASALTLCSSTRASAPLTLPLWQTL